MSRLVTLKTAFSDFEQAEITHLPSADGQSDYMTLCGMAADGDEDSGTVIDNPPGARVTCKTCYAMWLLCREFNAKHF